MDGFEGCVDLFPPRGDIIAIFLGQLSKRAEGGVFNQRQKFLFAHILPGIPWSVGHVASLGRCGSRT